MPGDRNLSAGAGRPRTTGDGTAAERLVLAAEDLAQRLPALLVAAERVAATVFQGVHGRRRVGQGESFWQFRRYDPGDPTTRIDWRQSAKSDRLYLRQTEWEAAQSVWLWRDASASMAYRSRPEWPSKRETAELLLLALGLLLRRAGERVSVVGRPDLRVDARGGFERLAAALLSQGTGAEPGIDRSPLPPAMGLPRHARLIVFADLLAPLRVIQDAIAAQAAAGVHGVLVQIIDPAEATLPFAGRAVVRGCEDEGEAVFGRIEALRPAYRQRFAAHRDGIRALSSAAGWTLLVHRIDLRPETALMALFNALAETPPRWAAR